jgi:uncharacterized protein (TIGR02246 family)
LRKQVIVLAPVLLVVCVANCTTTTTQTDSAADRRQIETAASRIWSAVARTDAASALAEYAEDAILLGPGSPMVKGKPAITNNIAGLFRAVSFKDVSGGIADITVSGDLAVETGTYSWTVVTSSGSPMPDKGKYVHVWARSSDGTWKVIRYIVNTDLAR